MTTKIHFAIYVFIAITCLSLNLVRADDPATTTESRLREALRDALTKLNDAQNQNANLQATQAQSDKDIADLKAKIDGLNSQIAALTKQSADDKAASDKTMAELNAKLTDQSGQIERLNQALNEWKGAYNQVVQLAADKEAARSKLALQAALLQRTVADRESKNLELYRTGNEILTRYEKFGMGDAIGAKEPFVGLTRVKLENLVQDYKDKLLNQTVTSGQTPDQFNLNSNPSAHPANRAKQESSVPDKPTTKA